MDTVKGEATQHISDENSDGNGKREKPDTFPEPRQVVESDIRMWGIDREHPRLCIKPIEWLIRESCILCGSKIDECENGIFLDGTWALVCNACCKKHNPSLYKLYLTLNGMDNADGEFFDDCKSLAQDIGKLTNTDPNWIFNSCVMFGHIKYMMDKASKDENYRKQMEKSVMLF